VLVPAFTLTRLDTVPLQWHHDEILVGWLGQSVAESGRDLSERRLPLYFQVPGSINWYPLLVVYATATLLTALSLSDFAVRLPNALVGTLSVWLIFLAARRMLASEWAGLAAATFFIYQKR
jgi:4-amino-4-deoxy-L-arabinose transferase-like glycosyltransferase